MLDFIGDGLFLRSIGKRRRGFNPVSLFAGGTVRGVWFDPSDRTTLFQDAAGTIPANQPGDPVGLMRDKSGRNNHATQPVAASRPTLARHPKGGRRNLLTQTENFADAAWLKNRVAIGGSAQSPVGPSFLVIPNTDSAWHSLYQQVTVSLGSLGVVSGVFKAGGYNFVQLLSGAGWDVNTWVNFDLSLGVVSSQGANAVGNIEALGNGWYRCTAVLNFPANSTAAFGQYGAIPSDTALRAPVFTGDGVSGVYAAGLQTKIGATPTPYQRVTTAYDVTEAGVEDLWYLYDDLVDDSLNWTAPAGNYTVGYMGIGGVTILENQALSGSVDILKSARNGGYIATQRAWTDAEKAMVTAYFTAKGTL